MIDKNPLISVVMPVYNGGQYLAAAIESILNQTFGDFEFLIVEDGSTDDSLSIIKAYQQKDDRIRIIVNDGNKGLVYSLNTAFDQVKSKYIARMDADDIAMSERLAKQVEFMEKNPDITIVGTQIKLTTTGKPTRVDLHHDEIKIDLLMYNQLSHPTVMIRKEDILEKNLHYKNDYYSSEDYKLWTQIVSSGLKVANLPDVLLQYRVHEAQMSSASNKMKLQQEHTNRIRKEYILNLLGNSISDYEVSIIADTNTAFPLAHIRQLSLKTQGLSNANSIITPSEWDKFFNDKIQSYGRKKLFRQALACQNTFWDKIIIIRIYLSRTIKKIFK